MKYLKYLYLFLAAWFISNSLDYVIWKSFDGWLFLYVFCAYLYSKMTYQKLIEEEVEYEENP